ncbi:MAG: hypothetical protein E6I01_01910 [Chloroflexi bacterium]|nr:MAG: hypothetical protein E6I01_01910 [Chloroflexota bacterium]
MIIPTLAILAVSSATVAMADNGVNLSVEPNATLTARLEVQMTMTASCPTGAYTMGSNVIVEQAIGKSIAHGTGYLPYFRAFPGSAAPVAPARRRCANTFADSADTSGRLAALW